MPIDPRDPTPGWIQLERQADTEQRVRDYMSGRIGTPVRLTPEGNMHEDDERAFLAGLRGAFQRELPSGLRAVFDMPSKSLYLTQHGVRVEIVGFDQTHILVRPERR